MRGGIRPEWASSPVATACDSGTESPSRSKERSLSRPKLLGSMAGPPEFCSPICSRRWSKRSARCTRPLSSFFSVAPWHRSCLCRSPRGMDWWSLSAIFRSAGNRLQRQLLSKSLALSGNRNLRVFRYSNDWWMKHTLRWMVWVGSPCWWRQWRKSFKWGTQESFGSYTPPCCCFPFCFPWFHGLWTSS